jgi:quercetin dioxygenase-like cupin family protein
MKQRPHRLMTALITTVAFTVLPLASAADTMITPMLKTVLEDLNGAEANVLVFDVDPGFVTDRHTHPGHVFIYVLEGALQLDIAGEESFSVAAGETVYELANVPMIGSNLSATERAKFVVFQVGPPGQPIMVPAPE